MRDKSKRKSAEMEEVEEREDETVQGVDENDGDDGGKAKGNKSGKEKGKKVKRVKTQNSSLEDSDDDEDKEKPSISASSRLPTSPPRVEFMSPIASPLITDKTKERVIKLLRKTSAFERTQRLVGGKKAVSSSSSLPKEVTKVSGSKRLIRRGITEVNKSIRQGGKGIVLLASDVYPTDIIAHMPLVCEKKDIVYGYLCPKAVLGNLLRSKRPTSVLLLTQPTSECPTVELFNKVEKSLRKSNPYF